MRGKTVAIRYRGAELYPYSVLYLHKPTVQHPIVGQALYYLLLYTTSGIFPYLRYKEHAGQGLIKASSRGSSISLSAKYIS